MNEQRPRSVLPDARDENAVYLFKACTYLRLTYEIRMMAFLAHKNEVAFVLSVKSDCQLAEDLKQFVEAGYVQIHRQGSEQ